MKAEFELIILSKQVNIPVLSIPSLAFIPAIGHKLSLVDIDSFLIDDDKKENLRRYAMSKNHGWFIVSDITHYISNKTQKISILVEEYTAGKLPIQKRIEEIECMIAATGLEGAKVQIVI